MLNQEAKSVIGKLQYIIDRFVKVRFYSSPKRIMNEPHTVEAQSDGKHLAFFGEIVSDKQIHEVRVFKEGTIEKPVPDFPEYTVVSRNPVLVNECFVDKKNNLMFFHSSQKDESISTSYYSIGVGMLSSSLVYTRSDSNGSVVETLSDLTRKCQKELDRIATVNDAEELKIELRSYIDTLLELMRLYPNPQEIIDELAELVEYGNDLKVGLDESTAEAKRLIDELKEGSNKAKVISPIDWVSTGNGIYKYEYNHGLGTTNLIVETTQLVNGVITSTTVDYEIPSANKIIFYSGKNNVTVKAVVNASYYMGTGGGSSEGTVVVNADNVLDGLYKVQMTTEERKTLVDVEKEVVGARGSEKNLKDRLNKKDEQLNKVIEIDITEIRTDLIDIEDNKADKIETQNDLGKLRADLDSVKKYPLLIGIEPVNNVKDFRYDYGNVLRYGADKTGAKDSYEAIQVAIDVCEILAKTNILKDVYLETGTYLITKTLLVKGGLTPSVASRPISIVGEYSRVANPRAFKGAIIKPLIPNHTGKSYANAIAINVKYNSNTDDNDTATFGNDINSETTVANILNISFSLTDEESAIYNINAIKSYRTKVQVDNCMFHGCDNGVYMPKRDKDNKQNYSDEIILNELYFTKIKTSCIELATPDKSTVTNIRVGHIRSTFKNTLLCTWGSNIKIDNVLISYHGDVNTNGSLNPRNDGTGQTGVKNHFEFIGTDTIDISGVYVERQMLDYLYCFENCYNANIDNTSIKFISNGLIRLKGNFNENIDVKNTYSKADLVSEYIDMYKDSSCVLKNVSIKNTLNYKYYQQGVTVNLNTDLQSLGVSSGTKLGRATKTNFNRRDMEEIDGTNVSYKISYNGTSFDIQNYYYEDKSSDFNPLVFNSGDGLQVSMKTAFKILVANPSYTTTSSHIPTLRKRFDTERIFFYDKDLDKFANSPDTKCNVDLIVNTVL